MKELFNHPCFSIASIGVQFRGGPGGEALDFGDCEQIGVCIDPFGHSSGSLVLGRPLSGQDALGRQVVCMRDLQADVHTLADRPKAGSGRTSEGLDAQGQ
jgi:hypothetical protein